MSGKLPGGGIELSPAEIEALDARWSSSWTPGEVARYLAGIAAPWCVAAGWALDQADFDATVPHMTPAQREALAGLLARVHPVHPWLADL